MIKSRVTPPSSTKQSDRGSAPADIEFDLLGALTPEPPPRYRIAILAASILLHLLFFTVAVRLPAFTSNPAQTRVKPREVTHLYLPPDVLTQRAPNRTEITKSIDLASLMARNESSRGQAANQNRTSVRHFELPRTAPKPAPTPQIQRELPPPPVPQTQTAAVQPGVLNPPLVSSAPPQPPKPNLSPFQDLGSEVPDNPNPTLRPPKADLQSAVKGLAQQNNSDHMIITDQNTPQRQMPGTLGNGGTGDGPHAAIELQSDPQGADFRAYLTQVLSIVRANWRRVIPESARLGAIRGRTTVEFVISRDGKIPKMVIATSSGSQPLDRAAAAGLSMSEPLPPLPSNYRGLQVRLAFTFTYNVLDGPQ